MFGEMYPVRLCLTILSDAPASLKQVSGGSLYRVFGSIRLFYLLLAMVERVMRELGRRVKKTACGWGDNGTTKIAKII